MADRFLNSAATRGRPDHDGDRLAPIELRDRILRRNRQNPTAGKKCRYERTEFLRHGPSSLARGCPVTAAALSPSRRDRSPPAALSPSRRGQLFRPRFSRPVALLGQYEREVTLALTVDSFMKKSPAAEAKPISAIVAAESAIGMLDSNTGTIIPIIKVPP